MKRKIASLFVLVLIVLFNVSGQTVLRENVCVVSPVYSPNSVKFIQDLSKKFRKDGYKISADILESYTKGGFGSGFIYTDESTGKSYIITNRHVVAQAEYATIEFQYSDKPSVKLENCPVIAVDEQIDLALIELPANDEFPEGLKIYDGLPEEGTEVISVGFPGLAGKPSWQFGQGIISNSSVMDKLLMGNNSMGAIQHTAQVDAGSSGGPLLTKTSDGEYLVVGVNTWKAKERESANFAISSKALNMFLSEYGSGELRNTQADLRERAIGFADALQTGYVEVLPYISSDYMANLSANHFYELVNAVPDSLLSQITACFNSGRPIDGIRLALAYTMYTRIGQNNLTYASNSGINGVYANVNFNSNKKDFPATWIFEQGEWRLQNLPNLKLTDLETQGISKRFGYKNAFKLGMDFPVTDIWGMYYNLTYAYTYATFVTGGISVGTGMYTQEKTSWGEEQITLEDKRYYSFDVFMGGQVPIKVSSIYIIPNFSGVFELNSVENTAITWGLVGGLEGAYKLKGRNYLLLGLSYKYRFYTNFFDNPSPNNNGFLGLHLGITW